MKPIKKQVWDNMSVFALLNGISIWNENYQSLKYVRKPYETNLDVRDNVLKSHDYKTDITQQGLINSIYNELDLIPYNVLKKSIFYLSYNPVPSGNIEVQDISGFYKTSSGTWNSIGPQIWSDNYFIAKQNKIGFIVWEDIKFNNISNIKNYTYSNVVEVFREFNDKTELKFEYYIQVKDSYDNINLIRYTDMNCQTDSNDIRYTYRFPTVSGLNLDGDIFCYTLGDIPSQIKHLYMDDNNYPTQLYYDLKNYLDNKYKHRWDKITNNSCIWDINKNYGSGQINSFYDALAPENHFSSSITHTGYYGGIESLSYSLHQSDFLEISGNQSWYLKLYPGKFYIDGIPFYYFENPQVSQLDLILSGNLYYSSIPSGLSRGMYTIASKSGYYDTYYCNNSRDEFLSGVYEDYSYRTGFDGNKSWGDIYRKRPNINNNIGFQIDLDYGQYKIDFDNNLIYFNLPNITDYNKVTFVWDNLLVPSGSILYYDLNPLNEQNLSLEKFFMYLSLVPNKYYNSYLRP
ncbi:MAG: hypothetical protein M0R17_02420 [Candidatus Omnitrophica bacterium]|jgi:hypothetical protein|nr:hypothetical protein [Candidatus Omnitrophota bacterium]